MKLVYFGNNVVGLKVLRWLVSRGVRPVALVVHPEARQRLSSEMIEAAGLPRGRVFAGSRLREAETLEQIAALEPTLGLSVFFGYILKPPLLRLFPGGVLNLHPSYLPYNRGAHPNVWSIIEGTPAGATLHFVDEGVDTGDLVAQKRVEVVPEDTAKSLYDKLEHACISLFQETWVDIEQGDIRRWPQPEQGTSHRVRDLSSLDRIDLDRRYSGRELLDLLRARSFPPHRGAYFEADGKRVYVRVELEADTPPRSE